VGDGELQKQIRQNAEPSYELLMRGIRATDRHDDTVVKVGKVLEIVEEAKRDFPQWNGVATFYRNEEGRDVIDGNAHPEYYRRLVTKWFKKWLGEATTQPR